jgi:hypothetical protein
MRATTLLAAVVVALLIAAAPASATGNGCASTAKVVTGTVVSTVDTVYDAMGTPTMSTKALSTVRRGPLYIATTPVALSFQGFTFKLGQNAIFGLNCSGAAGDPKAMDAMIDLRMGSASVRTGGGKRWGTIGTEEMLLDPYAGKRMTISASRTPKGDPTVLDVLRAGPGALRFGRSEVTHDGAGYVNITPHIGRVRRTNGLCHQALGATIGSTGMTSDGYLKGSIAYRGLWSGSPR